VLPEENFVSSTLAKECSMLLMSNKGGLASLMPCRSCLASLMSCSILSEGGSALLMLPKEDNAS
jgi:hypothetical protein